MNSGESPKGKCTNCHGSGWINIAGFNDERCGSCQGSGTAPEAGPQQGEAGQAPKAVRPERPGRGESIARPEKVSEAAFEYILSLESYADTLKRENEGLELELKEWRNGIRRIPSFFG